MSCVTRWSSNCMGMNARVSSLSVESTSFHSDRSRDTTQEEPQWKARPSCRHGGGVCHPHCGVGFVPGAGSLLGAGAGFRHRSPAPPPVLPALLEVQAEGVHTGAPPPSPPQPTQHLCKQIVYPCAGSWHGALPPPLALSALLQVQAEGVHTGNYTPPPLPSPTQQVRTEI